MPFSLVQQRMAEISLSFIQFSLECPKLNAIQFILVVNGQNFIQFILVYFLVSQTKCRLVQQGMAEISFSFISFSLECPKLNAIQFSIVWSGKKQMPISLVQFCIKLYYYFRGIFALGRYLRKNINTKTKSDTFNTKCI